jgi:hypothetical protein
MTSLGSACAPRVWATQLHDVSGPNWVNGTLYVLYSFQVTDKRRPLLVEHMLHLSGETLGCHQGCAGSTSPGRVNVDVRQHRRAKRTKRPRLTRTWMVVVMMAMGRTRLEVHRR